MTNVDCYSIPSDRSGDLSEVTFSDPREHLGDRFPVKSIGEIERRVAAVSAAWNAMILTAVDDYQKDPTDIQALGIVGGLGDPDGDLVPLSRALADLFRLTW